MHNRLIRSSILTLLIVVGIGAASLLWNSREQSIVDADRSQALNAALDGMLADLSELSTAQQAYVVPGQGDGPWITRVSSLLQRLYDETGALGGASSASAAPSGAPSAALSAEATGQSMRASLDTLVAIDSRAREYLRVGQDLMAADLVFNEAREAIAAVAAGVKTLRTADADASRQAAGARDTMQASVLGATAAIWLVGLVLLVRVPPSVPTSAPEAAPAAALAIDRGQTTVPAAVATELETMPAARVSPSIDWQRAAGVCTDLARLTDGAALPSLLSNVGQALDGSGVILWLGAGEQLFAAAAHGYDDRVLARLGPIHRGADNATAAAWRVAEMQTVAGNMVTNGAIAAPVLGHDGCRGVLAVELRNGRESDPAVRAVIAMVAAQLGGLVAAWPAASVPAAEPPAAQAM